MSSARLKTLEREVEHLRAALYQAVKGEADRLSHAAVLPISRELDRIMNQYHAEKDRKQ
ncbi:Spo0E family sporulation regulatory protein-aspartic acid phosphatase [Salinithrix halophila]|uniref:Spo0E family sporulation regulatory protein-aspartic acid phosphatase n=1 Tax=Salinithrix halophila TaxID=1485204 RepID=A0ABV8JH03_9BACL